MSKPKIKRICKNCGKEFLARVPDIRKGWGNFCSKGCATTFRNQGENNPNWKNGISKNNYHYKKLQKERYPIKVMARDIVAHAIQDERLVRCICEVCGNPNTQAHHDDYSKPLEVRWLCVKHHREFHKNKS